MLLVAVLFCTLDAKTVHAQTSFQNFNSMRSAGRATQNYLYNRPTVSPYLNLTRRDSQVGLPSYYTQVRPQLERRQQDQMQQRQAQQTQRELASLRNNFRQQQNQGGQPLTTGKFGWSSRGMPRHGSTLNYYPGFFAARRR